MEEKALIYVAGNPDAYPLEYYSPNSKSFEGVIPQLLQEFSQGSDYEIVYYQPGETDLRRRLAKNQQVDLLSGYEPGDDSPTHSGDALRLSVGHAGEEYTYRLYFTVAAPKAFREELREFFEEVSQEQVAELLVETAQKPETPPALYWALGSLVLAVVLLLAAIALLVRRYRKKLREALQTGETDETTGLGNLDYLERYYKQYVNDQNRILYQLIYFYVDIDRLRRISGSQEADEFLRYCAVVLEEYLGDSDILAKVSEHGFVLLKLTGNADTLDNWISTILDRIRNYTTLYAKPFESTVYAGIYGLQSQE